ncbi:MAG TPA: NUDIX domain-containing protein [Gammaproteobacteria bacterium]
MKRTLLVLRHGKSDWPIGMADFKRPLKERGRRDAKRVGLWIIEQKLIPDYVITSTAERAITTAEKICKVMGVHHSKIIGNEAIYEAEVDRLIEVLHTSPEKAKTILLIGHNPGLESLLLFLGKDVIIPEDGKLLPTAALARLEVSCNWKALSRNCAKLLSITRPKQLPEKFPYPDENGSEYRDRPAYYYSQAAVIPYRFENEQLQILAISSSNDKKWIIPKGIIEPGSDAKTTAIKEAYEEAGIEGEITEELGKYSYDKWGGKCNVQVYAMHVTHMMPEQKWPEWYRQRQWLNVKEAVGILNEKKLTALIKKLKKHLRSNKAE